MYQVNIINRDTNQRVPVTSGDMVVTELYHWDEQAHVIYFRYNKEKRILKKCFFGLKEQKLKTFYGVEKLRTVMEKSKCLGKFARLFHYFSAFLLQ